MRAQPLRLQRPSPRAACSTDSIDDDSSAQQNVEENDDVEWDHNASFLY